MKAHPRGRVLIPSLIGAAALVVVATVNHAAASGDPNRETLPDGSYIISSETSSAVTQPNAKQRAALGMAPLAKTATSAASDDPPDGTSSTAAGMSSYMNVVYYDPKTGKTILKKHYGSKFVGKKIPLPARIKHPPLQGHGTGGTSSASGCNKVTIGQTHKSISGHTLYTWQVYIDWCWNRANQVVTINSKDWNIKDKDAAWAGSLEKLDGDNGFYDFSANDGHPKSAFKYGAVGDFVGPNIIVKVAHELPHNDLRAYYNGTNQWWTSCQC